MKQDKEDRTGVLHLKLIYRHLLVCLGKINVFTEKLSIKP